ncbi:O-antigen polymerase [Streptococcus cameli]
MSMLYVLLLGLILLFFLAYILSNRDILAPSVLMTIMFIISTLFAIPMIGPWNIQFSWQAMSIILSGIFVFICAESFTSLLYGNSKREQYSPPSVYQQIFQVSNGKLFFLLIFNIIILFWYYLKIRSIVGGNGLSSIFLLYRRMGIANKGGAEVELVSGIIIQFIRIVEMSGFAASYLFIQNIISKKKKLSTNIFLFLLILVSILPSIFSAGRSRMLRLASAILIEYYILWHQQHGWNRNLSWKMIRIGISTLIIGIPSFYYSLALLGRQTSKAMFEYVAVYISSGIVLFSDYLRNPVNRGVWGEESLFSLLKVLHRLGLSPESTSYNLEFRRLGLGYSNIYSFFRRPLHDFGLFGMYVFIALIAVFFAWIYYGKIKNKHSAISSSYWVLTYAYLFYWIVSSSILQYSVAYISVGTITNLIFIFIIFIFLTSHDNKIKIKF